MSAKKSVRRIEEITEALWGTKVSPSTVSELNQKIYAEIESWRNQPITGSFAYVYLDGLWLKRSWGGEVKNVSMLVAMGVREEGYREVLGVMEGAKEDKEAARKKAAGVVEKLKAMKPAKASELVKEGIEETLHSMDFPREHWRSLRTNNPLEHSLMATMP
jgi:transposase-like protein